jgi:hypothetical protein
MPDLARLFSELDTRYGLPTAAFLVASVASFTFGLKDGFHFANRMLLASGFLFFIAFGLYVWHQRDGSSTQFTGEKERFISKFWNLPWKSAFGSLFCFIVATMFAFVAWEGGIAADKGESISLHVKEVHRTQETTNYGFDSHITAVVESKTIEYSIKCTESYSLEKRSYTGRCFGLSAGKDYPALKFPDSINFWPPGDKGEGYVLILYDIVGEKEK